MTAYVNIAVASAEQSLLVPNAALRYKPTLDIAAGDEKQNEISKNEDRKNNAGTSANGGRSKGARSSGGRKGNKAEDLAAGKIYILKDGKPSLVRVRVGITDGRFTAITARDLAVADKVIVGELQANGQAQQSGGNMRTPRMF
jgi:HlyD family secretion protein